MKQILTERFLLKAIQYRGSNPFNPIEGRKRIDAIKAGVSGYGFFFFSLQTRADRRT